ncbi:MAG: hypothetical protein BMS9Abin39_0793 [Ignavibacteria bacterium]|nr:MAG: hypothetical protein BMS9Abin39_0793 [Ignavibacteria bacterium]
MALFLMIGIVAVWVMLYAGLSCAVLKKNQTKYFVNCLFTDG